MASKAHSAKPPGGKRTLEHGPPLPPHWLTTDLREQLAARICGVMQASCNYDLPEWVGNACAIDLAAHLDRLGIKPAEPLEGAE